MVRPDFLVSEESLPALRPYASLPIGDPRRHELFSFLANAIDDPNGVVFEQDDDGLRWTWLQHVALVWKLDLAESEIDVVDVWDDGSD